MGLVTSTAAPGRALQSCNLPRRSTSLRDMQEASDMQIAQTMLAHLLFCLKPGNPDHVGSHLLSDPLSSLFGLDAAAVLPSKYLHPAWDRLLQKEGDQGRTSCL